MRQVIHALLTRPPLSHKIFISEENRIKCFVRLACVRHAASVHPEPGSNSHVKSLILSKTRLANILYCFKVVIFRLPFFEISRTFFFIRFFLNLSRLFHCLIIKVLLLTRNFYRLSPIGSFVNNFFIFFTAAEVFPARWSFIIACYFEPVNHNSSCFLKYVIFIFESKFSDIIHFVLPALLP